MFVFPYKSYIKTKEKKNRIRLSALSQGISQWANLCGTLCILDDLENSHNNNRVALGLHASSSTNIYEFLIAIII